MSISLDPTRIALKYQEVPGAKLIGWQHVGLAVYTLDLRVVVIKKKPIEPIDEFLLRTIFSGVGLVSDIALFLGLDLRTVNNHLADLHRAELINILNQDENDTAKVMVELTAKGKAAAKELNTNEISEENIPVRFHGIDRRPVVFTPNSLLNERECMEQEFLTIPALPARRPSINEIKLDELDPIANAFWQKRKTEEQIPELIGIKSLAKEGGLLYQPAIMLIYQMVNDSSQRQYSFVVDGERKDKIDQQFAIKQGEAKLPPDMEFNLLNIEESAKKFFPEDLTKHILNIEKVGDVVERAIVVEEQIEELQHTSNTSPESDTKQRLSSEIDALKSELIAFKSELDRAKVVPLRTTDCDRVLKEAIKQAKNRLVIVSGTISQYAVDSLAPLLEEMVRERDVELWLGYGMGGNNRQSKSQRGKSTFSPALAQIERLGKIFPEKVRVADLGNSHTKILLCDDDFVIIGSHNWLSHKPSGMRTMLEHAFMAKNPESIVWFSNECERLFKKAEG